LSQRPRLADLPEGRFGRLFPDLPSQTVTGDALLTYGAANGPLEFRADPGEELGEDNPRIPAGWPFFGQFIAHDITHDRVPLQDSEDINTLENFRKPRLDLECVYGAGPVGQPYLYDVHDPDKFLIGARSATGDLPRNEQGLALVGDARNDTHLFISQLHLAFLHFHNRMVDRVRDVGTNPDEVFERAARMVRWHYQWIVLHEFLPLSVGNELVGELFESGPKLCRFEGRPYIPVEFSDGAYRFGHAQIRTAYDVNTGLRGVPIFPSLVGNLPRYPGAESGLETSVRHRQSESSSVEPQDSAAACPAAHETAGIFGWKDRPTRIQFFGRQGSLSWPRGRAAVRRGNCPCIGS